MEDALIVHSIAIDIHRVKVSVETLAAFLIVRVGAVSRVTFGEIEPMRRPVGEHKQIHSLRLYRRFEVPVRLRFSPIRRKNCRFFHLPESSLSWRTGGLGLRCFELCDRSRESHGDGLFLFTKAAL